MSKVLAVIGGVVAFVASVIGIWVAPRSFWEWWYPLPLILLLGALLVAALAWIVYRARHKPSPPLEQATLDRLLTALPRVTINELEAAMFEEGWTRRQTTAIGRYVSRGEPPEDRFRDPEMELLRATVFRAATEYDMVEGGHGFASRVLKDLRTVGWDKGELYYDPDDSEMLRRWELAQKRYRMFDDARDRLVVAHRTLVEKAHAKGYDLFALDHMP